MFSIFCSPTTPLKKIPLPQKNLLSHQKFMYTNFNLSCYKGALYLIGMITVELTFERINCKAFYLLVMLISNTCGMTADVW